MDVDEHNRLSKRQESNAIGSNGRWWMVCPQFRKQWHVDQARSSIRATRGNLSCEGTRLVGAYEITPCSVGFLPCCRACYGNWLSINWAIAASP